MKDKKYELLSQQNTGLEAQVRRLVVENRNSLNDPTTNEPYDVEGIVDDVTALFQEQQLALLDEVDKEVVGADRGQNWDDESGHCMSCDFQPTDGSSNCICTFKNELRAEERAKLAAIKEGLQT